jgi:hypothetical protein
MCERADEGVPAAKAAGAEALVSADSDFAEVEALVAASATSSTLLETQAYLEVRGSVEPFLHTA